MSDLIHSIHDWFSVGKVEKKEFSNILSASDPDLDVESWTLRLAAELKDLSEVLIKRKNDLSLGIFVEEFSETLRAAAKLDKDEFRDGLVDTIWTAIGAGYAYDCPIKEDLIKLVESNYSKYPKSLTEVDATIQYYQEKGIEAVSEKSGEVYVVKNAKTGKILKSVNYITMFDKF